MKEPEQLVNAFADQMKSELRANAHKGDWRTWSDVTEMVNELDYHIMKLKKELRFESENNPDRIKEYLADNANFLLMIGNAYGLY